jgi:hypothetical protein
VSDITTLPEKNDEAISALEFVKSFVISSADDYKRLDELCVAASQHMKKGESLFAEPIANAHKTHKDLCARLKAYNGPAEELRKLAKPKLDDWNREQDRLREEAQRKADEEARKLAEKETLAEAEALEQSGDVAGADRLLEEPLPVAPVYVPSARVKGATVVRRIPDLAKIEAAVRAKNQPIREVQSGIPGVTAYYELKVKVSVPQQVPEMYKRAS